MELLSNCQKICHGVHGYHGLLRSPVSFPCAASRVSRFDHGCLKRGCCDRREHSVNATYILIVHVICIMSVSERTKNHFENENVSNGHEMAKSDRNVHSKNEAAKLNWQ